MRELTEEVRTDIEFRREAFSMSLYVAIVLLSALTVFDEDHPADAGEVFLVEIGTTVGLVLAHGFASWVSATVTRRQGESVESWDLLWVQLLGAGAVAGLAMAAVVIAPTSVEVQAARITVAGTIGVLVFLESRSSNSVARAVTLGLLALVAGVVVAIVKSHLAH